MARKGFDRRWRLVRLANPAAGVDWQLLAPGSVYWRIVSVMARLTSDANAATRVPAFIADDRDRRWFQQDSTNGQAASTTFDYCLMTGNGFTAGIPTLISLGLPAEGLLLLPGNRLRVATTGIQVGDQWSNVTALVDEIPSDSPYVSNDGFTRDVTIQE